MAQSSKELGTESIGKLLIKQSVPASVGFLIMSIYSIVDTIYVGRWVGPLAIGAITVVMPISFLISSVGMAIGVGGGSIILPNVIIGENSVIGGGSVVTKNVPPRKVVAGSPAKQVMSIEEYKSKRDDFVRIKSKVTS